jgi:hypothetical protein
MFPPISKERFGVASLITITITTTAYVYRVVTSVEWMEFRIWELSVVTPFTAISWSRTPAFHDRRVTLILYSNFVIQEAQHVTNHDSWFIRRENFEKGSAILWRKAHLLRWWEGGNGLEDDVDDNELMIDCPWETRTDGARSRSLFLDSVTVRSLTYQHTSSLALFSESGACVKWDRARELLLSPPLALLLNF